jgi:heparosan-N-sulfate-glucuronate 5-epimerase
MKSVLSRGVGYEHTPQGSFIDPRGVRGYYIDFSAKTTSPSAANPSALLPAGLAQLALGWWERSLAGEHGADERFRRVTDLLVRSAEDDRGALVWLYRLLDRKYHIAPPTISCLSQAQAASVLVRRYVLDGDPGDADLARRALRPLLSGRAPTVVAGLDSGPALEEAPSAPPSLILNGWIYALWGLRDVALALDDRDASTMLEASTACLTAVLPRYDVGWWSRYSLYPHRLPDLAKLFYHRLHVEQLEVMHTLTSNTTFQATAERWSGYDTQSNRVRLVMQKLRFVASGYR